MWTDVLGLREDVPNAELEPFSGEQVVVCLPGTRVSTVRAGKQKCQSFVVTNCRVIASVVSLPWAADAAATSAHDNGRCRTESSGHVQQHHRQKQAPPPPPLHGPANGSIGFDVLKDVYAEVSFPSSRARQESLSRPLESVPKPKHPQLVLVVATKANADTAEKSSSHHTERRRITVKCPHGTDVRQLAATVRELALLYARSTLVRSAVYAPIYTLSVNGQPLLLPMETAVADDLKFENVWLIPSAASGISGNSRRSSAVSSIRTAAEGVPHQSNDASHAGKVIASVATSRTCARRGAVFLTSQRLVWLRRPPWQWRNPRNAGCGILRRFAASVSLPLVAVVRCEMSESRFGRTVSVWVHPKCHMRSLSDAMLDCSVFQRPCDPTFYSLCTEQKLEFLFDSPLLAGAFVTTIVRAVRTCVPQMMAGTEHAANQGGKSWDQAAVCVPGLGLPEAEWSLGADVPSHPQVKPDVAICSACGSVSSNDLPPFATLMMCSACHSNSGEGGQYVDHSGFHFSFAVDARHVWWCMCQSAVEAVAARQRNFYPLLAPDADLARDKRAHNLRADIFVEEVAPCGNAGATKHAHQNKRLHKWVIQAGLNPGQGISHCTNPNCTGSLPCAPSDFDNLQTQECECPCAAGSPNVGRGPAGSSSSCSRLFEPVLPPRPATVASNFARPDQVCVACRGTRQGQSGWYMDSSGIERYLLKNPEDQQWWCTIDPTVLCFSDLEGNVSAPTLVLASSLAAGRKRSVQGSRSLGSLGSAGSHGRRGLPVIEAVVVTDGVPQALGQRQQSGLSNSSGGSSWREPSGSIASDTSDDGDDDGGGGGGDGDMNGTSQSYFRFSAAHPVEVVKVNRTGLWKSDVSSRSILPQQSAGVNTSHLKAVRGTTVGSSGWYTDIRTGSTNFYIVQDGRPHTHDFNFSGRVWMVVSKADLQTSDWALLLSQAVLVTVDGTRRGSRGAYRTFCFPAFRGEIKLWRPCSDEAGLWTFSGSERLSRSQQVSETKVAAAAHVGACARCGGIPTVRRDGTAARKGSAELTPKKEHLRHLCDREILAPGHVLLALDGHESQGQSGWYGDGTGSTFFLAVDGQGRWRQLISYQQRLGVVPWQRLSSTVPVLARCESQSAVDSEGMVRHEQAVLRSGRSVTAGVVDGFNETATVNGGSTTAMDRQNGQSRNFPNSARAQSGHLLESDGAPAGSPGYYCRLNDVTGAWSTQTEYWIEHPVSKVWTHGEELVQRGGPRNKCVAWSLCLMFGWMGAHRCYLRNVAMGFVYGLTLGVCCVGWISDSCRMKGLIMDANRLKVHPSEISAEEEASFREDKERPPCAECICCCFALSTM